MFQETTMPGRIVGEDEIRAAELAIRIKHGAVGIDFQHIHTAGGVHPQVG
jgi:hypothetical protein